MDKKNKELKEQLEAINKESYDLRADLRSKGDKLT